MDVIYYILSLRGRTMARYRRIVLGLMESMERAHIPICKAPFSFPHPKLNSGGSWASGVPGSPPSVLIHLSP